MRAYAAIGRIPLKIKKIANISTAIVLDMFYNCHEFHFDGKTIKQGNKLKRTGFYTRICWPYEGCLMEQYNIIIELFKIIKNEESKIDSGF